MAEYFEVYLVGLFSNICEINVNHDIYAFGLYYASVVFWLVRFEDGIMIFCITFVVINKTYSWQFCGDYNLFEIKNERKLFGESAYIFISKEL